MANIFTFVGIDRYSDPTIRDLSGAGNDARALWALFMDTFPDAISELLINENATGTTVRHSLEHALLRATEDDVAWVFFAGHGTRDHRLVMHDTQRNALSSSAIAMQDLAELFRQTKARAAFLILDCCFSGGITARVLEDSPLPRDLHYPLQDVAGEGRIVITASRFDEPAYELPGHDHGVLTKALLDTFEEQEHRSILSIIDKVLGRIAAEAARIGVKQTPVFWGDIQGGLSLPRMLRGANYEREFPDQNHITVGTEISGLAAFQLPNAILQEWTQRFPNGLNQLQAEAVNRFRILAGKSLLVIAPTSSGKTFIGEICAAKAITQNRKAVFLLPYRALVNEKFDQFQRTYSDSVGLRVIRCTGDYSDQVEPFVRGKYDLAILTYEMFLNLAVSYPGTVQQLGLVVLDEAQFITDPNRGITVELLLTYLLAARERGIHPQIIALSAVIGDANRFNEWLDVQLLRTDHRPVPLTEGVLDRYGLFHTAGQPAQAALPRYEIQQRGSKPSSQDVLVPLLRKLTAQGQKVLIFRNIRAKTEGCARYLARDLGLDPANEALGQLPQFDGSASSASLRQCLVGGTAFHNSNLSREEREIVERFFRDPASPLRVLVATTTVAAGINTPASTVIIAEQEFVGEDGRQFTVAEYKNMAGRAGRLGFNEEGTSIVLSGVSGEVSGTKFREVSEVSGTDEVSTIGVSGTDEVSTIGNAAHLQRLVRALAGQGVGGTGCSEPRK
jgi:helicase